MKIIGMGLGYPTGEPLLSTLDEADCADRLESSLAANQEALRAERQQTSAALQFRDELNRQPSVDLADPTAAGWTFLVGSSDPDRNSIVDIIRPLAVLRGMRNPANYLTFEIGNNWTKWMLEKYTSISLDKRPHYILMIGGPEHLPFHFQSFLDVAASVGRVSFDSLEDLSKYVEKLIRLETQSDPETTANVVFFGPDYGRQPDGSWDATYFSRRYMIEPLAQFTREDTSFNVTPLMCSDATKKKLLESIRGLKPALVYTASHGIGAHGQPLEIQKRVNGAISCQRTGKERRTDDYLLTADDITFDAPFLEGGVLFQFACYGYGTPALSDFSNWNLKVPRQNATADFIAALPKKLLAHPRGPIGYIGHVDTAWLHGFDDPDDPMIAERWNPRLVPFKSAIKTLLHIQPAGLALADLGTRYNFMNARLAAVLEEKERGEYENSPDARTLLASDFISRSDAQNYLVFGDPAARLRVAAPD